MCSAASLATGCEYAMTVEKAYFDLRQNDVLGQFPFPSFHYT